jgi:hypothetical protein
MNEIKGCEIIEIGCGLYQDRPTISALNGKEEPWKTTIKFSEDLLSEIRKR